MLCLFNVVVVLEKKTSVYIRSQIQGNAKRRILDIILNGIFFEISNHRYLKHWCILIFEFFPFSEMSIARLLWYFSAGLELSQFSNDLKLSFYVYCLT